MDDLLTEKEEALLYLRGGTYSIIGEWLKRWQTKTGFPALSVWGKPEFELLMDRMEREYPHGNVDLLGPIIDKVREEHKLP